VLPAWSSCTGVWLTYFFVSGGRCRYEVFALRLQSRIRVPWRVGGWTKLVLPLTAEVVDGE